MLAHTLFVSSQVGLFFLFILACAFIFFVVFDMKISAQVCVIWMLLFITMTSFGLSVSRILLFPCLYLLLLIPLNSEWIEHRSITAGFAAVLFIFYLRYLKIYKPHESKQISEGPIWTLQNSRWLIPTVVAFNVLMVSPWLADNISSFYPLQEKHFALKAPEGLLGWIGPLKVNDNDLDYEPIYPNASATLQVEYSYGTPHNPNSIYVYTAYYDPKHQFLDMVEPKNSVYNRAQWQALSFKPITVSLDKNASLILYEQAVQSGANTRLIWYWYNVAGFNTIDFNIAEWFDKVRIVSNYNQGSCVMVLSSVIYTSPEEARLRLTTFLRAMYPALQILQHPDVVYLKR